MMRHIAGVRLLWTDENGAEHLRDFSSVSEAREAVAPTMADWVIVERTYPGRYATVGRVLDSIDDVTATAHLTTNQGERS